MESVTTLMALRQLIERFLLERSYECTPRQVRRLPYGSMTVGLHAGQEGSSTSLKGHSADLVILDEVS